MHVQLELPQQCVILVISVAIWPWMVHRQEVPIQWQPRNGAPVVQQLGGIPRYDVESCPGHHSHDF